MKSKIYLLFIAFCCFPPVAFSQLEVLENNKIQTVPTFNGCSYYYRPSDETVFRAEYKRTNETAWRAAHPTVCDQPEKVHKGSLFNLSENTEYQIRILTGKGNKIAAQTGFRTWSSTPRIAKTIDISTLPNADRDGVVITEQGTPDAWIKYTAPAGWILKRTFRDADTRDAAIVLKDAKFIILENLVVEGGKRSAILVDNCDFVRILNCDISGWGRIGVQQFINDERIGQYKDVDGKWINYDGGITIRKSFATVVERCYIHDPRGRSNAWVFSHPAGPQAIVAEYTRGGNVIRWNDFVGSDEHRWNDVIECLSNSSPEGGLHRDSDITGNYLAFGNDDGIELEGGGINLRFTGNKVEGTLCGISLGANMVGPQYVVGNLIANLGDEEGLALNSLKNGHGVEQKGKRLIYNNTFHGFGTSAAGAYNAYGNATPEDAGLGTMRNNIFVCDGNRRPGEWARAENFDNDLFWVNRTHREAEQFVATFQQYGQEKNALVGDPQLIDPAGGNFRLASSSPARGKSVEVAGITVSGDDLGAFFNGATDIPLRPLALTTTPAQLNFQETGGNAVVTLGLSPDAGAPVEFQIRRNTVFDWFTVTPARGVIAPGETLKLTVTANPGGLTGRPVFRGAFLVRTPNGLSRPVSVYAKGAGIDDKRPASAGPNTVYIDAKDGAADTQINIPKNGTYALLVRASGTAPRRSNQKYDIKINDETSNVAVQSGYWYVGTDAARAIWLYSFGQLKAGTNRISIKPVSPDLKVEEYIITDNPAAFFIQERNARR